MCHVREEATTEVEKDFTENNSSYSFDLNRLVALAMRVELGGAS